MNCSEEGDRSSHGTTTTTTSNTTTTRAPHSPRDLPAPSRLRSIPTITASPQTRADREAVPTQHSNLRSRPKGTLRVFCCKNLSSQIPEEERGTSSRFCSAVSVTVRHLSQLVASHRKRVTSAVRSSRNAHQDQPAFRHQHQQIALSFSSLFSGQLVIRVGTLQSAYARTGKRQSIRTHTHKPSIHPRTGECALQQTDSTSFAVAASLQWPSVGH